MNLFDPQTWLDTSLYNWFLLFMIIVFVFLVLAVFLFASWTLLLRFKNSWKASRWNKLEDRWEPVMLDILSGEAKPEMIWRLVGRREYRYFLQYLVRYHKRITGREQTKIASLARPYLPQIMSDLSDKHPERRAGVIRMISRFGMPEFANVIVDAMDDPSPLVTMVAIRALAKPEHPEYFRIIVNKLPAFLHWSRNYLSSLLVQCGSDIIPVVRKSFANSDFPPEIRAVFGQALMEFKDPHSASIAAYILETETDREVLSAALRLLSEVGRAEDIPKVKRLVYWSDPVVRTQAVKALRSLAGPEDAQYFRELFDDPSKWVAIQAATGLANLGARHILRALAQSAHKRADLARQALAGDL